MRDLSGHKVNGVNDGLSISVLDDPGHGGACHKYLISGGQYVNCAIEFQNGTIPEVGVNGVTHEALLEVLIDRLRGFQSGQFACRENAIALTKLQEAQMWLLQRTRDRAARGVEGTHTK